MKPKEEILKDEYAKIISNAEKVYVQNPSIIKAAHSAMDIHAKQDAIAFAKWIYDSENDYKETENFDDGLLFVNNQNEKITAEQLYELYQKTKHTTL